jgi:GT2 family glycosyltransferase
MPELEVFHKVAFSTGGGDSPFTTYYSNRNRIYFIKKNLVFPQKWIALSYTLITRGVRLFTTRGKQQKMLRKGLSEGFKM